MATEKQVTIIVNPPAQVNITAAAGIATGTAASQASAVSYEGGTGLSDATVEAALDTLAHRQFTATTAPTGGEVIEGDTWYDSDDDKMYVRRNNEWNELITDVGNLDGGEYN
jgi:hypothetical protein